MLLDYAEKFYLPALKNYERISKDDWQQSRELATFMQKLQDNWADVAIFDVQGGQTNTLKVGDGFAVQCRVTLGDLEPDHVVVEVYSGTLKPTVRSRNRVP